MAQNRIQFQPGLSLEEFQSKFSTEEQCEAAFAHMRWPHGFVCPNCGNSTHSSFLVDDRTVWQCSSCRYQTTVRAGTIMHSSKISLLKWFLAIYLISQDKNGHSALSLKRYLGICYRTAWRLKHKLLEVVAESELARILSGDVVADDAYLGGVHKGKRGRGSENKVLFIAAVQLDAQENPSYVRFDLLPNLKKTSIRQWAKGALDSEVHLTTDGFSSLTAAADVVAEHTPVVVSPKKSSDLKIFRWVNTSISNLKTAISGTYHHVNFHKYATRYLGEFQYRFNHRANLHTIPEKILDSCAITAPCPEKWLRLGEVRNL